jgi:hypothetical protein
MKPARIVLFSLYVSMSISMSQTRFLKGEQAKKEYFDHLKAKLRKHRGDVIDQWLSNNKTNGNRDVKKPAVQANWNLCTLHKWSKEGSTKDDYTYHEWCMLNQDTHGKDPHCQDKKSYINHYLHNDTRSIKWRKRTESIKQCTTGFIKSGYWSDFKSATVPQCVVRGAKDRPGLFSRWQGKQQHPSPAPPPLDMREYCYVCVRDCE